jgi:hypothetical protein
VCVCVLICTQALGEGAGPLIGSAIVGSVPETPTIDCHVTAVASALGDDAAAAYGPVANITAAQAHALCSTGFGWASFFMGVIAAVYAAIVLAAVNLEAPLEQEDAAWSKGTIDLEMSATSSSSCSSSSREEGQAEMWA